MFYEIGHWYFHIRYNTNFINLFENLKLKTYC